MTGGYLERPGASSLAEVIDTIVDKGVVLDVYVRVSLLGIELVTVDARVVVASVDTYLRFAESVNRLDLTDKQIQGVTGLAEQGTEAVYRGAAKGAVEGVKDVAAETVADLAEKARDTVEDVMDKLSGSSED